MADPNSLKDKKIGVQTGTVSAAYAQRQLVGVGDVKLYATLDGALADLKAGRLDYVAEFVTFLTPFLKENPTFVVKAISPLDPVLNQGIAVGVRQDDEALRAKINEGIVTVIDNGTYDEILGKYPGLGKEIRRPQVQPAG